MHIHPPHPDPSPNGRYLGRPGVYVVVSRTPRFEVGVPRPLFELRGITSDGFSNVVSRDGDRVLIARPTTTALTPLRVVVNWNLGRQVGDRDSS
jgi:hypothetical protein